MTPRTLLLAVADCLRAPEPGEECVELTVGKESKRRMGKANTTGWCPVFSANEETAGPGQPLDSRDDTAGGEGKQMERPYDTKGQFRVTVIEHLLADYRKTVLVVPVLSRYGVQVIDLVSPAVQR